MKNLIQKIPLGRLGYDFIEAAYLPDGENEYYLRNLQNRNGINYRQLTAYEIEVLVRNRNSSDNWNNILVSDAFTPELVKNCKFFGLVRIGKLEPYYLEFSRLKVPVGLYNSTIISCDFGDNVVVDNVNYMSHYIIGSEAIIINVNELMTTPHSKFGNGILKTGEDENIRIWMEICNETGGRKVIPFNGMLPGDAWLWSKHRDNEALLNKLKAFTQLKFDTRRGYYGKVGDRTVIKNCAIIKDVWIGSDAYLKGANKLKNLTINSKPEAKTQIGEGCELVNGIIGYGCRVFYGVKAVRFVMSSNSQLKYGARLINSYLGDNATISCCEVLNSLIFPNHEQHHNNSFLCASVVMGQSNMAAGATIGSNHNSRSNDGELMAKRGFWPGLCVSLKHNSRFAAFTLIAKGDYPAELDITLPFSLVSRNTTNDQLQVMPAYWFRYNMYALARNTWKYQNRDLRPDKVQFLEFEYLAPDTAMEILEAMALLERLAGKTVFNEKERHNDNLLRKAGREILLINAMDGRKMELLSHDMENSKTPAVILKAAMGHMIYKKVIRYYCITQLLAWCRLHSVKNLKELIASMPAKLVTRSWQNIGGQLMPADDVQKLLTDITDNKIKGWDDIHERYRKEATAYPLKKAYHALSLFKEVVGVHPAKIERSLVQELMEEAMGTRKWLSEGVYESRKKDHTNPYRKMLYDNEREMEQVLGRLDDNEFIQYDRREVQKFASEINYWKKTLAK
ncbi:MAG TPA: DUF4954 family protein [Phnomibacter sp.]|nr:DUF4954 family protein [Phnomibacter sp.]